MSIAANRFDNAKRRRPGDHDRQRMLTPDYVLEPIRALLGGSRAFRKGRLPSSRPNCSSTAVTREGSVEFARSAASERPKIVIRYLDMRLHCGYSKPMKHGDTIKLDDGRYYRVLAVGATEDGATYVHLASVALGVSQKNGHRPLQVCGWLRGSTLTGSLWNGLSDGEWSKVFAIRCRSKRGEHLSDENRDLIERAFKSDAKRYRALDADVFDATIPAGSMARAKRSR